MTIAGRERIIKGGMGRGRIRSRKVDVSVRLQSKAGEERGEG